MSTLVNGYRGNALILDFKKCDFKLINDLIRNTQSPLFILNFD